VYLYSHTAKYIGREKNNEIIINKKKNKTIYNIYRQEGKWTTEQQRVSQE